MTAWQKGFILLAACAAPGMFVWSGSMDDVMPVHAQGSSPAGSEDIDACSPLTSIDNKKTLRFGKEHDLELTEEKDGSSTSQSGTWVYDQAEKRYILTFGSETTSYVLVTPEAWDMCILAKGNASSADLKASWYGRTYDDDPKE